ncbi:hypothetical protein ASG63_08410 [Methylobacterium sp. Leaf94]|uniref:hypothetical protein n=1 Tax=Methylobacterium sp. Leaf94 TaxID=1736250 RepID=UPI0006FD9442|nr:hypothetical protein [Methylobacterium sp. Leaf94]KQU17523.1 hypothetical protein ASG63_08410 [Methylobacterium sp. Leaf94]
MPTVLEVGMPLALHVLSPVGDGRPITILVRAGVGTPAHEVAGGCQTITDRTASSTDIAIKRRADIDLSCLEHQVSTCTEV